MQVKFFLSMKPLNKFFHSFLYAARGICQCFQTEQNFRFHTLAAICALVLGVLLRISPTEFSLIFIVIALVMSAELLNTAIEKLCDFTDPNQNETIGKIKDLSAGMVLVTAIGALGVGILIFLPKLYHLRMIFT